MKRDNYREKDVWTQAELADFLVLSLATACRMVQAGQIPYILVKSGKRKKVVRFRKTEIEGWLRSHSRGGGRGRGQFRNAGAVVDEVVDRGIASEKSLNSNGKPDGYGFDEPVAGAEGGHV